MTWRYQMYVSLQKSATALSVAAIVLAGTAAAAAGAAPPAAQSRLAAAARQVPVLGSKAFEPGHNDRGFGHAHPKRIFNGGDPSGLITHIQWTQWGAATAHGWGKTYIFKPQGGYYPRPVRAELRAGRLGHCSSTSPLAYRHLAVREPSKPGGKLGAWFSWSGRSSIC
jgi:hypothetical protein